MKNPSKIHQIWIGSLDNMPEDERKYSDEIKLYCKRLNIEYHLWTEEELRSLYPDDAIWTLYDELPDCVRKYTLLSDYFRIITLNPGELYLDVDMKITRKPQINFSGHTLLCMGEYWNRNYEATAFIGVQDNFTALESLKDRFRLRIYELNKDTALDDLTKSFGPEFFREAMKSTRVSKVILSKHEATHIQWKNNGALIHMGAGAWCKEQSSEKQ